MLRDKGISAAVAGYHYSANKLTIHFIKKMKTKTDEVSRSVQQ
jgi:hypothetical protein